MLKALVHVSVSFKKALTVKQAISASKSILKEQYRDIKKFTLLQSSIKLLTSFQ